MIQQAKANALSFLDSPKTTRAFQIVALASLMLGVFVGVKQYSLTTCLAEYNDAAARVSAARAATADEDRASQRQIFNAFAEAVNGNPAEAKLKIQVALARWQAQQDSSDKQRSQNPILGPPTATC